MLDGYSTADRRVVARLGLTFAAIYLVQAIAEPTEGLVAQPVRALLANDGESFAAVSQFWALIALPWVFKPFYGLLSDHVPLIGRRRKSYLLWTIAVAAAAFGYLALSPPADRQSALFGCMVLAAFGVSFADVVVDALMVEHGQPRGMTGLLQSIQWTAIYGGTILTGWLGGQLSAHHDEKTGFAICAAALVVSFFVCLFAVREKPDFRRTDFALALAHLREAVSVPAVWAAGGFIWLWNFNPFSTVVLQLHMTRRLGFSEEFYGESLSLQAIGSVVASLAYGFYCRRIRFGMLLHASIVLGIASTLAYWTLRDAMSARCISLAVGFTYMSATMMQLDLAARACPLASAATVFATLMALSNLSAAASTWLGGTWYVALEDRYGTIAGFDILVGVGALFTAGCWLLVPWLRRTVNR
jgi:MFS family permease